MMMHGNMPFVWQTGTGRLSVKVGDEAEGRKRPTSTSTLGFDCTGKLLFIEAGQQQKNDRYLCMWSPTALTNKHIHMHIEPISSFPFLHFFSWFSNKSLCPVSTSARSQKKSLPGQRPEREQWAEAQRRDKRRAERCGCLWRGAQPARKSDTAQSIFVNKSLTPGGSCWQPKKKKNSRKNTRLPSEK